jgi:heme/copper-type cytochrome/quinol oxidase subunit 3
VSGLVHPATDYEVVEGEPPELLRRNLYSAAHLLASATAFFFIAFVFAYFYLRSLNNAHLWRPRHVDPPQALGALVMAALVATAVVLRLGHADQVAGRADAWRRKGAVALVLGLAVVGLQIAGWAALGFGPADGGYASVFVGWTAFLLLFVVGALYWLETALATSVRYRRQGGAAAPGEASGDPGRPGADIDEPTLLVDAEVGALAFYWSFLAGIGVLTWIVLYLA